jgi:hypothetical protein
LVNWPTDEHDTTVVNAARNITARVFLIAKDGKHSPELGKNRIGKQIARRGLSPLRASGLAERKY